MNRYRRELVTKYLRRQASDSLLCRLAAYSPMIRQPRLSDLAKDIESGALTTNALPAYQGVMAAEDRERVVCEVLSRKAMTPGDHDDRLRRAEHVHRQQLDGWRALARGRGA